MATVTAAASTNDYFKTGGVTIPRSKGGAQSRNKYYSLQTSCQEGELSQIAEQRGSQESGWRGVLSGTGAEDNISNNSEMQLIDRFDDRIDPQLIVKQMQLDAKY